MGSLVSRVAALGLALAASGVLGGCGWTASDAGETTTHSVARSQDHDDTDVTFLQKMILHDEQTLQLCAMVGTNTDNAELIALAAQIEDTQGPMVQAYRAQLLQWQLPLTDQDNDQVDGLLTGPAFDKLNALHGADFDTSWLQSMVGHSQGAITMAQTEIDDGQSTDVVSMATAIVTSRQAEIDQMTLLLGG